MTNSTTSNPPARGHELHRPPTFLAPDGPLSISQIDEFFQNGVVVVPQLLSPSTVRVAREAYQTLEKKSFGSVYAALRTDMHQLHPSLLDLATNSPISQAAAQLTPNFPNTSPGRELIVIRDAIFHLRGDNKGCYFHVDDFYFWPAPLQEPGPGLNVWVALDEVDEDGGGLAFAPGSHKEEFLECREAVQSGQTCLMDRNAPELARKLEEIKSVPKMKAGDAIFMTRFLFHRADPFKEGSKGAQGEGVLRYSARYMPGVAQVREVDVKFEDGRVVPTFQEPIVLAKADQEKFPAVKM